MVRDVLTRTEQPKHPLSNTEMAWNPIGKAGQRLLQLCVPHFRRINARWIEEYTSASEVIVSSFHYPLAKPIRNSTSPTAELLVKTSYLVLRICKGLYLDPPIRGANKEQAGAASVIRQFRFFFSVSSDSSAEMQ